MGVKHDLKKLKRAINQFTVGELRMIAAFLPTIFFVDNFLFHTAAFSLLHGAFTRDAETCMKTWGAAPGVLLPKLQGLDDFYAELILGALNNFQRLPEDPDNSDYFQALQDDPVALVKAYLADHRAQPGRYSMFDKDIQEFVKDTCPAVYMDWWLD